jgi:hypothetical protein
MGSFRQGHEQGSQHQQGHEPEARPLSGPLAPSAERCTSAGLGVAAQWPDPNCCCYNTTLSDTPTGYPSCSVQRANIVCAVLWLALLVAIAASRNWGRSAICLCLALLHLAVVTFLKSRFKRYGGPSAQQWGPQVRAAPALCLISSPRAGAWAPRHLSPPGPPPAQRAPLSPGRPNRPNRPLSPPATPQGPGGAPVALPAVPPSGQVMGIPVHPRHIPVMTAELSRGAPLFQGQGAGGAPASTEPRQQLAAGVLQPAPGLRQEHLSARRQEAQVQGTAVGVPAWLASSAAAAAAAIPDPPPPSSASSASRGEVEQACLQASSAASEARASRVRA